MPSRPDDTFRDSCDTEISGPPGNRRHWQEGGHCSSPTRRSPCSESGLTRIILAAFLLGVCHAGQAQQTTSGGAVTLFQNVRIFDGKSGDALRADERARPREQDRANLHDADPDRSQRRHRAHRRRRAHADARADRHALAHDAGAADARGAAHGGRRLPQPGGRRRGYGHADARVHHRSRHGRAGVRAQARHRRGHRRRPAHLSVRRHHHRHQRSRRLPPAVRSAARPRRPAVAHGADSAPPWSPTVRTRSACACASSSCWARRRSS